MKIGNPGDGARNMWPALGKANASDPKWSLVNTTNASWRR